jgi:LAO/AO transport system kinase
MQLLGLFASHDEKTWHPKALQLSALNGLGVDAFWQAASEFRTLQIGNGQLAARRQQQSLTWMWERIDAGLKLAFQRDAEVGRLLPQFTQDVLAGRMAASTAARNLLLAHTGRA